MHINSNRKSVATASRTLTDWARLWTAPIVDSLARLLSRIGVSPNSLTIVGFTVACAAGGLVAMGNHRVGGLLLLLSGGLDALDGALARLTHRTSAFGAFLDSFLDRYSESALLFGLAIWATYAGRNVLVFLVFLTMIGSIMVSYARARAEGLRISCKVGLFSRLERFIVLVATLLTGYLIVGFCLLSVVTHVTAVQRMMHVYKQSITPPGKG